MKGSDQVIQEFNDLVNMTVSELKSWLESEQSTEAGWPKDDGSGETVGHESGRKIVKILESNPNKDAGQYTDDQIDHMRKVVSYCKRHLAQEESSLKNKPESEAKKTKSYISLKNWGHDPLKQSSNSDKADKSEENGEEDKKGEVEAETGDKRSAPDSDGESLPTTSKARKGNDSQKIESLEDNSNGNKDKKHQDDEEKQNDTTITDDDAKTKEKDEQDEKEGKKKGNQESDSSVKAAPKPGDEVSWEWGNGQPRGKVVDVKEEKTTVTTKNGNKVSRDGSRDDPAVVLDTGKSKAIKSNHELLETTSS